MKQSDPRTQRLQSLEYVRMYSYCAICRRKTEYKKDKLTQMLICLVCGSGKWD